MFKKEKVILKSFGFDVVHDNEGELVLRRNDYWLYLYENGVMQLTKKRDNRVHIKYYGTNCIENTEFTEELFTLTGVIQ